MNQPHFVYIADVYCPWCYAFAPIMGRIARENPGLPVRVIGGNLISRPLTLMEDAASSPGLTDFWREVQQTSGRSLEGAIRAVETGADVRMYSPGADEILTVLRSMAPGHDLEQLFELEDMFYGQGLDLFSEPNLDAIASRWGLTPASFERAMDQPAALAATEKTLDQAGKLMGEITSYPSVLLARNGKVEAVSRGYVHYETVASRLADAMRDLGLEPLAAERYSRHHGCTAGRCA